MTTGMFPSLVSRAKIDPTRLVAFFGTNLDLDWVLAEKQRNLLLGLPPEAIDLLESLLEVPYYLNRQLLRFQALDPPCSASPWGSGEEQLFGRLVAPGKPPVAGDDGPETGPLPGQGRSQKSFFSLSGSGGQSPATLLSTFTRGTFQYL